MRFAFVSDCGRSLMKTRILFLVVLFACLSGLLSCAGGTRLAQELKGKGTVVVFTMPSQPNLKERLHGYKDALEASPQIKLAHIVDVQGDPRIAFDTTTQYLANDKKEHIDAFICLEA